MTSSNSIDLDVFERILQMTVSVSFIDQLCRKRKVKIRRGIYSLTVVVWLMIYQRLNSKRTLSSAVQFLAREALHWRRRPQVSKRMGGRPRSGDQAARRASQ
jgi:predicted HAD superfamily hydrolase